MVGAGVDLVVAVEEAGAEAAVSEGLVAAVPEAAVRVAVGSNDNVRMQ